MGGCSSIVDDEVIIALAQGIPKLEVLRLDRTSCETPAGTTVHGLITLAFLCLRLSKLQIHFLADGATTTSLHIN